MIEAHIRRAGYGPHSLLENISFVLPSGTLNVLTGPNGSGKTTLLKILAGIHADYAGEVKINRKLLSDMSDEESGRHVAVVFSRPAVTDLRVREILATGRFPYLNRWNRLKESDRRALERVSQLLDLKKFWDRPFSSLSDGEKQRVMIGRALVQDTPVLLLDEPEAHLDIGHRAELLMLLKRIASEGKTVLFSSHYLDLFFDVADRLLVIRNRTLWSGSPDEAIRSGIPAEVFGNDLLEFDSACRSFVLKKSGRMPGK